MTTFQCRDCLEWKDVSELVSSSLCKTKPVGRCKPCKSTQSLEWAFRKRMKERPNDFMECDDCDRVFSIFTSGRPTKFKIRQKRTHCPYCDSEEIYGHNEATA